MNPFWIPLVKLLARVQSTSQEAIYVSYRRKYALAPSFRFNGPGSLLYGDGEIHCGECSYIGHNCFLQAESGYKIVIGRRCALSHNVKVYSKSYLTDQDFCLEDRLVKKGNVIVGDGVWVGVNTYIGPGVTVGENAVIAANSVVTADVEPYSIVAGNPARLVRYKKIEARGSSPAKLVPQSPL